LRNRINNMDDKNLLEKGFTLVELLVVVAILGILAAVAIFAVGNLTDKAEQNACKTEMGTVETASDAYRASEGSFAASTDDLVDAGLLKKAPAHEGTGFTYTAGVVAPVAGSDCA
jgi:prepilin-type N-terminal cleavage/methylation domain-containing protein